MFEQRHHYAILGVATFAATALILSAASPFIFGSDELAHAQGATSLSYTKEGLGSGTVYIKTTAEANGSPCAASCTVTPPTHLINGVTLTAVTETGSVFSGWSGACTGTATTCTVNLPASVSAMFSGAVTAEATTLSVTKSGTGSGIITSASGPLIAISCGTRCSGSFNANSVKIAQLVAFASDGSIFTGWSGGGCAGSNNPCVVNVLANTTVTATFATRTTPAPNLTYTKTGTGSGTVTASIGGVCASDCVYQAPENVTSITLTAAASAGSVFSGWSGACTGLATTCTTSLPAAVSAAFSLSSPTVTPGPSLSYSKEGNGSGTLYVQTSVGAAGPCADDCTVTAPSTASTSMTLTINAASGSVFSGWSGACTGTSTTCTVTLPAEVTATFSLVQNSRSLIYKKEGLGSGTVNIETAAGSAGSCAATCTVTPPATVSANATLVAVAASGSVFAGWSGACTGTTTTCAVTLPATVTATFTGELTASQTSLTVTKMGNGQGTVVSVSGWPAPAIACGVICAAHFPAGTSKIAQLVATAAEGSVFLGWSGGGCVGGNNPCVVNVLTNTTVSALFSKVPEPVSAPHSLDYKKEGNGWGTINGKTVVGETGPCGADCTITIPGETSLSMTITATASAGSYFSGWGGACSGNAATCTVTLPASVSAKFTLVTTAAPSSTLLPVDKRLVEKLKGRIVLQVQGRGEAWYVNPVDGKRYHLKDGETAYQFLLRLGIGISNTDLSKIPIGSLK